MTTTLCHYCATPVDLSGPHWVPIEGSGVAVACLSCADEHDIIGKAVVVVPMPQNYRCNPIFVAPTFECIGGPWDGEFRPPSDVPGPDIGGFYVLDDTPKGAQFTWLPFQ